MCNDKHTHSGLLKITLQYNETVFSLQFQRNVFPWIAFVFDDSQSPHWGVNKHDFHQEQEPQEEHWAGTRWILKGYGYNSRSGFLLALLQDGKVLDRISRDLWVEPLHQIRVLWRTSYRGFCVETFTDVSRNNPLCWILDRYWVRFFCKRSYQEPKRVLLWRPAGKKHYITVLVNTVISNSRNLWVHQQVRQRLERL